MKRKLSPDNYSGKGIRFLRINDIDDYGKLKTEGGVYIQKEAVPKKYFLNTGDLLFSRSGTVGRTYLVKKPIELMCYASNFIRFSFEQQDFDLSKYIKDFSATSAYWNWIGASSVISTIQNVNGRKYSNLSCPVPPRDERILISQFIDKKTSQIDTLVSNIEKKIELLKEYRIALINQYVTKGLNPKAKMKDSGVAWLGQIPKHWQIKKIKNIAHSRAQYGLNISPDSYSEKGIRFIRINDVSDSGELKQEGIYIKRESVPKEYFLNEGDLLFSRSGTVGRTYLVGNITEPMCYAGYFIRFSFGQQDFELSKYIKAFSATSAYWNWIDASAIVSTIQNVNGQKYSNLPCPVPPDNEMKNINKCITSINHNFSNLVKLEKQRIKLLKEYRESLISNVVTGKVRITKDML